MMIDVDYLSRMHNALIKSHVLIANQLSLADRSARPGAYSTEVLVSILQRGKYSVKLLDVTNYHHLNDGTATYHIKKILKTASSEELQPRFSSPVQILTSTSIDSERKWSWRKDDSIRYCENLQTCSLLSINRHPILFDNTEE